MKAERNTVESVTSDGLCTGCGTCVAVCPRLAVEMVVRNDIYVPQLDREACNECGICVEACPGHAVDFGQLNLDVFGKLPEDVALGNHINCYVGHATDHGIRYSSASGGLVTALLICAREQGLIDGALVTRMSDADPLRPEPFVATTREEILSAARSKYCPVPANVAVRTILERHGEFAAVGLPCHIHGIRKAELNNTELREEIALHLGIFCSHTDSFALTRFVLREYGISERDVSRLDYRGEGWPGSMTVHLRNGVRRLIPLDDYIPAHGFGFFAPRRCALCCDHTAELADVSCGDAWLPEIAACDQVGTSIVMARTDIGEALCRRAVAGGHVELEEIGTEELRRWSLAKKRGMKARSRLSRLFFSGHVPDYGTIPVNPAAADYLRSALLGLNARIGSQPRLRRSVGPLCRAEQLARSWLGRIRPS